MALNASDLSQKVSSAVYNEFADGKSGDNKIYVDVIQDYIKQNLEINATYFGTTPLGSPDSLNGPVVFKAATFIYPSAAGKAYIETSLAAMQQTFGPQDWWNKLHDVCEFVSLPSSDSPKGVTITPFQIKFSVRTLPDFNQLKNSKNYKEAWNIWIKQLVDNLLKGVAQNPSTPTTTVSGSGTTTFNNIK